MLSAYGMALAEVAVDLSEPLSVDYTPESMLQIDERLAALKERSRLDLLAQGVPERLIRYQCYLNMRYNGSDTKLMILRPDNGDYLEAFRQDHLREFAFVLETGLRVENVRVRAIGGSDEDVDDVSFGTDLRSLPQIPVAADAHFAMQEIFFEESGKFESSKLYKLDDLTPGSVVSGPALILDKTQTILLHPQNRARILRDHVL